MAHSCPECDMTCHCNGDIDDICLDGTEEQERCTHWKECNALDDDDDDNEGWWPEETSPEYDDSFNERILARKKKTIYTIQKNINVMGRMKRAYYYRWYRSHTLFTRTKNEYYEKRKGGFVRRHYSDELPF